MRKHDFSYHITKRDMTVDLELTNKCNLHCTFCPREKTPKTGFMAEDVFSQAIQRIKESIFPFSVTYCGLGDPLLHPHLEDFVAYAAECGLAVNINTSGTLLTHEKSEKLIAAGISEMRFSVTGIYAMYEKYYDSSFSDLLDNIFFFKKLADKTGTAKAKITVVLTQEVMDCLDDIIIFWEANGIFKRDMIFLEEHNRAGSYQSQPGDMFFYSQEQRINSPVYNEVRQSRCPVPFVYTFIGWDGRYYLCALDWEKRVPIGHVLQCSISDIMQKKIVYLDKKEKLCASCSYHQENYLYDVLDNPLSPPRQVLDVFLSNDRSHQRLLDKIIGELPPYIPVMSQ